MKMLCSIFSLFNSREKRQVYWLSLAIIVRGLVEVAGVASIMPFIAVVSNPEIIQTNKYLAYLYAAGGFASTQTFLIVLGVIVFAIILFNNLLSALTEWALVRFTWLRCHTLARRLFAKYLAQPYSFFLNENTANLGANILNEVGNFIKGVLRPFMDMIAKMIVTLFIFALLLAVDPLLAVTVGAILGSAYTIIFILVRKQLGKVGKERVEAHQKQFLYINEALTGIKDIKVRGCESYFLESYSGYSYKCNMSQALHQLVSQLPRYALEVVAFGGILLITLYIVATQREPTNIIPLMALYAFAGYRMMPALQGVFAGITTVRYNAALIDKLNKDLTGVNQNLYQDIVNWESTSEPIVVKEAIELKRMTFSYPGTDKKIVNDLSLTISAKTTVGFVGTTGAGKTTLVDLILGLFLPQQGEVVVDGIPINAFNHRSWLRTVGYVPQQIFLSDQSVRKNIALGIDDGMIDSSAVTRAAKIAHLHEFIVNDLPEGYDTIIGERGVRLSGGQRQRIGIARAMYHDPDVLLLDEATSALDNLTEAGVMKAIKGLAHQKTIIIIAHRLTTLVDCDVVYKLANGQIIAFGTYHDVCKGT